MDNNVNFKSWQTPEFSDGDEKRLLETAGRKLVAKKKRTKIIRMAFAGFVILLGAASGLVYRNSYQHNVAVLRDMLEREIDNNSQMFYFANHNAHDRGEKEDHYEPSL